MEENIAVNSNKNNNQAQIAGAIIMAGLIIAGAILLKGSTIPASNNVANVSGTDVTPAPVSANDRTLGNEKAKVTLILYEDFQCPFCGAITGLESDTETIKYLKQIDPNWAPFMPGVNDYIKNGSVRFVYEIGRFWEWNLSGQPRPRGAPEIRENSGNIMIIFTDIREERIRAVFPIQT